MLRSLLLFLSISLLISCQEKIDGNGKVKSETRETAPFHSIDIHGSFEVGIVPAAYSSLTVVADENLHPYIETQVRNGVLRISTKQNFGRYRELRLNLNMKEIQEITSSGAVEIDLKEALSGDKVKLKFSGAVEANLALNVNELTGDFSGASELKLRGNATKMYLESSGATEIDAHDFKTRICHLDMSGAGQATLYVTEALEVDVSGAAEVRYRGNPPSIVQNISGAASIKPL